jgi:hypothetical protein
MNQPNPPQNNPPRTPSAKKWLGSFPSRVRNRQLGAWLKEGVGFPPDDSYRRISDGPSEGAGPARSEGNTGTPPPSHPSPQQSNRGSSRGTAVTGPNASTSRSGTEAGRDTRIAETQKKRQKVADDRGQDGRDKDSQRTQGGQSQGR